MRKSTLSATQDKTWCLRIIKSTLALLNNSFKNNEKWNELPADKIEAIKYEFFLLLVLTYRNLELMNLKGVTKWHTSNTIIKIVLWNYNSNYNNYKNNNDNNSWFKHKFIVLERETPEVIPVKSVHVQNACVHFCNSFGCVFQEILLLACFHWYKMSLSDDENMQINSEIKYISENW